MLFGSESDGTVRKGLLEQAERGVLFINELERPAAGGAAPAARGARRRQLPARRRARRRCVSTRASSRRRSPASSRGVREPFRIDLLTHLNVLVLRIPPLRDYAEDVPELLRYYVERLVDDERLPFRRFGVAAQNRLRNYPWPGNIRELKNLVHRLLIQGGTEEIRLDEIEREIASQAPANEPLVKQDLLALPLREAREHFERAYLTQQLQLCSGKVGQLAKRVGMERTHLYRKLRSLGVDFRQTEE